MASGHANRASLEEHMAAPTIPATCRFSLPTGAVRMTEVKQT